MKSKIFPFLTVCTAFISTALIIKFIFFGFGVNAKTFKLSAPQKTQYEGLYAKESLKLFEAETVKLSEIKEPIVLINFWATWCIPCLKKFKSIKKLQEQLGDKIKVLGVNVDEREALSIKQYKDFVNKKNLSFKSALDPEANILSKFHLSHVPAIIIYHKGKVVHFSNNAKDYKHDNVLAQLKKLLQ